MTEPMAVVTRGELASVVRDEARFRHWYDATLPRVYRYLAARCAGDDALAEELTQQTFVAALRNRDRFDGRSDVLTWLCAIARNRLIDHYRRHARETRRHDQLINAHRTGIDTRWQSVETRNAVEATLRRLPADQRLALLFRYLDGLSVREVASAIGRTEKATESLLARAREAFRVAYGDQNDA